METRIVKVKSKELGHFEPGGERLGRWQVASDPVATAELREAAAYLRTNDTPVAFPTETVYGLGADATRSAAVKGIYAAKGRPSDNPLIIHVSDLTMLRRFLAPAAPSDASDAPPSDASGAPSDASDAPDAADAAAVEDPIPAIYKPLLERFWPGPLTILLPLPSPSPLAPEVTAGLSTFAVRMPASPLALSLIALADTPLAAPSANASTKPSPTAARHVLDDLAGRIELILDAGPCAVGVESTVLILDAGPCAVGVESTVVDGLCDPPVVLRPGGLALDRLRACPGWARAVKAYRDASEEGAAAPRAPGMKYKHYSPRAAVVLYEAAGASGADGVAAEDLRRALDLPVPGAPAAAGRKIGVIRTRRWKTVGAVGTRYRGVPVAAAEAVRGEAGDETVFAIVEGRLQGDDGEALATILDIDLGETIPGIAKGLFSALRELDRRGVAVIFVDGVDDGDDVAAAVMNRLRKAASETRV
ncbi:Threonylcarbamoyl-AMP synthase like protein [Verticillium longisporum]|uniref:Threonylcarbamoyl-AMP synthase like protein n=1 Tax=Verticillium longisporum TaxID=100787 RepID=A0A8I3AGC9_VERLO|nr:Threonylcarbamoyl-AMP synthase like protein [Verticillium longisporum]